MRLKKTFLPCLLRFTLGVMLAGCASNQAQSSHQPAQPSGAAVQDDPSQDPLYSGDRIQVSFSGLPEPITPIETDIQGDGTISLIYIGQVQAAGKTAGQLGQEIADKYIKGGWYKQISVTVTPMVRFVYVGGEINSGSGGGRVQYAGTMTVTKAIFAAGGFDPFANKKKVQLTRRKDNSIIIVNCVEALKHPDKDPLVYPGDSINVPRRFW